MKGRQMKRIHIFILFIIVLLLGSFSYGDVHLYLFGKGNFFFSQESEYIPGRRDFSITQSHQNYGLGTGIMLGKGRVFFGLETSYTMKGKATLEDPSDDDTVKIDTYPNVSALVHVGFYIVEKPSWRLFINGGGGAYFSLDTKSKIYTSALGYETEIFPQEKKSPGTAFGGMGLEVKISPSMWIFMNGRYQYIALDESQNAVIALLGVSFSL